MIFRRDPLVRPTKDGRFEFRFPPHVGELVVHLGDQLDAMLDTDLPDLNRLFPTAYPDDPERDAGYQVLARGELIDHRRTSLDTVRATVSQEILSEDEVMAWLNVVNDLRLVIGTKLDVSEEDHLIDQDDPEAPLHDVYAVLGMVLGEIVEGLSATLPDEGTEDRI